MTNKNNRSIKLFIATYNVLTLRSHDRLEELMDELDNIKWDILGLAEIRRPGENCSTLSSGHILYHKNSDLNAHVGGIGFLINKNSKQHIMKIKAVSDRVIYLVINISKRYQLQVIQVYAPSSRASDEDVEQPYEDITRARQAEKARFTMIIGDFNAKIGIKDDEGITIMGNFGIGERNPKGDILLDYMQNEQLFCMNTFFKKPSQRKWTWKSPDGKTKNEIDFILSNTKHIITDVSVLNKFRTGSDHRLVRACVNINVKTERNKLFHNRRFPILEELQQNECTYQLELSKKINLDQFKNMDLDQHLNSITSNIRTATKKICMRKKSKRDRLSADTKKLMEERRQLPHHAPQYNNLNKEISKSIRRDIRSYKTEKILETIDDNMNMRALKSKLSNEKTRIFKIKNELGQIESDKNGITQCIEKYYRELYTSATDPSININNAPRFVRNVGSEDIPEIDLHELEASLNQMKNRRTPGEDQITYEMLKYGGETLLEAVRLLFNKCLSQEKVPMLWQNSQVILL